MPSLKAQVNKDLPLVRKKDGGTNYLAWREFTYTKLQHKYPSIFPEFMNEQVDETAEELGTMMNNMFIAEPLENSMSTVVPLADFEAGLLIQDPVYRKRFYDEAVEAMNYNRRVNNIAIARQNTTVELEHKAWVEDRAKKKNLRIAMASLLLSPEYMSADCLVTVQADARYSTAGLNTAWSIHQIIRETLSDTPGAAKQ